MAKKFKMPDIGEGLTEGEIGKWLVQQGDAVEENDPMVEVLTEKVNVEIPSPFSGTVLQLLAEEGEIVEVGTPIVVIGEEGESVEEAEPAEVDVAVEEAEPPEAEEAEEREEPAPEAPEEGEKPVTERVLATPAVRRKAREMEIDLTRVEGTGPRGRVTEEDLMAFAEQGEVEVEPEAEAQPEAAAEPEPEAAAEAAPEPAPVPEEREELVERVPIRGVRRIISEHMHEAKRTAAHFTYVEEVDVTELVALRERLKSWAEERGAKLTYLPFIIKALVATFQEHPTLNATVDWEAEEILVKRYYNIGIATATEAGLVVPVVKDAGRKTIVQLAQEIEGLAEKARNRKLELSDVQDSTFTITSLGAQGGLLATPIINVPEVAILGVHKIAKKPVVRDGQVVVRDVMNLSLSFDHRIVDGHVGAAFTQTLVRYLENPGSLLMEMLESE